jgi:hypothetical protein
MKVIFIKLVLIHLLIHVTNINVLSSSNNFLRIKSKYIINNIDYIILTVIFILAT